MIKKNKPLTKFTDILQTHGLAIQIIVSFTLLIVFIIILLSLSFYYYNISDLEQISINNNRIILSEVNSSIDSYVENIKNMGQVVVANKDVRELLAFFNTHDQDKLTPEEEATLQRLTERASQHMEIVGSTREEITNIAIIPKYGSPVLSGKDKTVNPYSLYRQSDWFLQPLSHWDTVYISPAHVQNLIAGEYRWVISISEVITDPTTGVVNGVMLIDLNYAAIESICNNVQLGGGSYVYLLDNNGNVITHPQQQLIYSGIKTEPIDLIMKTDSGQPIFMNEKIYMTNQSKTTGWRAVGTIALKETLSNRNEIILFYMLVTIVTILFSAMIIILISGIVTSPLRNLKSSMDKVRAGDLNIRSEITVKNEIGQLSDSFNIMLSQIQLLVNKTISDEKEKRNSEIRALQAQINPHFLYNTLDTIIWMSASGKNDEVMEVTSALAHLFRTSISQGNSLVSVGIEVENIKNYLVIQKMRYKDKLSYNITTAPDVENLFTPKLLLQPIVENALYHGIKPSEIGGKVEINIYREGDKLVYSVSDNGVGMTKEKIAELFDDDKPLENPSNSSGIGIRNVDNRVKLLFGTEYGLNYISDISGGTKAVIKIPAITEGDALNA